MLRARVLCIENDLDAADELRRMGADAAGAADGLAALRSRAVRVDLADIKAADSLRTIYQAAGGLAVVGHSTGGARLLLSASTLQHGRALGEAETRGGELREAAVRIRATLERFHSPPTPPHPGALFDQRLAAMFDLIGRRTLVMGILNVTPDSFSDGGRFLDPAAAVSRAHEMVSDGADIIDVGGESTRPGAEPVSAREEIDRVVPVIGRIAGSVDALISVDTCKASVAEAALDAGAGIINDISGASFDPRMAPLIAERRCPAVLMHIKGVPRDMQANPYYDDLMDEVFGFLSDRIAALTRAGADERLLMVDPGIGFGKTVGHNLELMRRLAELRCLGRPIVVGTSRKSTIGKALGDLPVEERLEGTAATTAVCIANGANIVRVHDVKQISRVARMTDAIVRGWPPG